jgi:hypothetical protein
MDEAAYRLSLKKANRKSVVMWRLAAEMAGSALRHPQACDERRRNNVLWRIGSAKYS